MKFHNSGILRSVIAQWLRWASEEHAMHGHDPGVMDSNPGGVKLVVHNPFIEVRRTKNIQWSVSILIYIIHRSLSRSEASKATVKPNRLSLLDFEMKLPWNWLKVNGWADTICSDITCNYNAEDIESGCSCCDCCYNRLWLGNIQQIDYNSIWHMQFQIKCSWIGSVWNLSCAITGGNKLPASLYESRWSSWFGEMWRSHCTCSLLYWTFMYVLCCIQYRYNICSMVSYWNKAYLYLHLNCAIKACSVAPDFVGTFMIGWPYNLWRQEALVCAITARHTGPHQLLTS